MVVVHVFDEGEVETRNAGLKEWSQIGVVRQAPIDFRIERARVGGGDTARVQINQVPVAGTGLEQQARTARAARIHIHNRTDALSKVRVLEERVCSEQTSLLAIS